MERASPKASAHTGTHKHTHTQTQAHTHTHTIFLTIYCVYVRSAFLPPRCMSASMEIGDIFAYGAIFFKLRNWGYFLFKNTFKENTNYKPKLMLRSCGFCIIASLV